VFGTRTLSRRLRSFQGGVSCGCFFMFLIALVPVNSFAALGGDLNSVVADQVRFQGSLKTTQLGSFQVHEIRTQAGTTATGTVIREYMSPSGTVFAVTWRGQWLPDMRQLLGPYFQKFVDAVKEQASTHPGRRPMQIVQPDFVVQINGHAQFYAGRVYLPEKLPAAVQPEAIQ
jgi:hypothetical protein